MGGLGGVGWGGAPARPQRCRASPSLHAAPHPAPAPPEAALPGERVKRAWRPLRVQLGGLLLHAAAPAAAGALDRHAWLLWLAPLPSAVHHPTAPPGAPPPPPPAPLPPPQPRRPAAPQARRGHGGQRAAARLVEHGAAAGRRSPLLRAPAAGGSRHLGARPAAVRTRAAVRCLQRHCCSTHPRASDAAAAACPALGGGCLHRRPCQPSLSRRVLLLPPLLLQVRAVSH
jgi:hypothetical protein